MVRSPAFDTDTALEAALDTFWRLGYSASTIQILLQAMGLNRGSLYNSFGDKESLFRASLDLYFQTMTSIVVNLLEQSPNPVRGIELVFDLTLIDLPNQQREKGCLLVNTMAELSESDPELARYASRLSQRVRLGFVKALNRSITEGYWHKLEADPEVTADLLFNLLNGLRISARSSLKKERIRAVVRQTLDLLELRSNEGN